MIYSRAHRFIVLLGLLFGLCQCLGQSPELKYVPSDQSQSYSIHVGLPLTLGLDSNEVKGIVTELSSSSIGIDSISYPLESVRFFRKGAGSKTASKVVTGAGLLTIVAGILSKDEGIEDRTNNDVLVPFGALVAVSGIASMIKPKYEIGEEGQFKFSTKPNPDSLVTVHNADSAVTLLVRFVRWKKQREHLFKIGDFVDFTIDRNEIYRGFIQDIQDQGIVVSSRFIAFDSITRVKIKGVKKRTIAGGVILGLGVSNLALGAVLLNQANEEESEFFSGLDRFLGTGALITGVLYSAIGGVVMSSNGRLTVKKDGVEFIVKRP